MDRLIALVVFRWRMELRALLGARERLAGLLLLTPVLALGSLVACAFVFVGLRALEASRPELLLPVVSAAATGIGLLWALSPLLAPGGVAFTESHDMSRLLHFPIPLPTLVVSSLLANLAQPMVLVRLPVLLAVGAALAPSRGRFPLALAGALLTFVFMLAADQAAGLLLHGLSRNRRLHDVALFLGLGLGFLLSTVPVLLFVAGGPSVGAVSRVIASDLFAASPYAWGIRASVLAGRGETALALSYGLLGIAGTLGAMTLSAVLIHRIHRGELDLGGATGAALRARMVLPGTIGALVEKDLRAAWRDPALKATLVVGLLGPLLFLFVLSQAGAPGGSGSAVLLLASFMGVQTYGANAFGLERRGVALLMTLPVPRWRILVGKNLSAMALRLPGVLTLVLAALLLAPPAYLPAALAVVVSTFLIASGFDNYLSILFPVAAPPAGRSPYAGGAARGRGLGAALLAPALLFVVLLASSPFAFLAWLPLLLGSPWLWLVSLPLAVAGAAAVYAMLVAGAARLLSRREPELLERILGEE